MKKPKPTAKPASSASPTKRLYTVRLATKAQRQLDRLPLETIERVTKELIKLAFVPRPTGVKKLKGREGYRIRVGDYRVIYTILDKILLIEVVKVGTRGNFYDE